MEHPVLILRATRPTTTNEVIISSAVALYPLTGGAADDAVFVHAPSLRRGIRSLIWNPCSDISPTQLFNALIDPAYVTYPSLTTLQPTPALQCLEVQILSPRPSKYLICLRQIGAPLQHLIAPANQKRTKKNCID